MTTELKKGDFVRFVKAGYQKNYFGYFIHTFDDAGVEKAVIYDPSCTSEGYIEKNAFSVFRRWQTHKMEFLVKESPPADYPPMPRLAVGDSEGVSFSKPEHVAGLSPEKVDWDKVMKGGWTE